MSVHEGRDGRQVEKPTPVMLVVDVCECQLSSDEPYPAHPGAMDAALRDGVTTACRCPECSHACTVRLATPADHAKALGLDAEALEIGASSAASAYMGETATTLATAATLVRESEATAGGG